jgi:hypothetical protein
MDPSEAQHFDLDGPGAVGEIGEGVRALLIGDGGERFTGLGRGYCCAGDWETAKFYLAVVFGGC